MKKTLCLLLTLIFVMVTSAVFAQEKKSKTGEGWILDTIVDSYQIGVGDILEITTWKEPDFTRENVLVRTDGKISFPLLNDFPAAGLSPMELKYNLEKAIKGLCVKSGGYRPRHKSDQPEILHPGGSFAHR